MFSKSLALDHVKVAKVARVATREEASKLWRGLDNDFKQDNDEDIATKVNKFCQMKRAAKCSRELIARLS